ncbi:hypothetical protein KEM09_09510 [Carboxylicivirga mesophila]|uniref:Uncharacterized protein n=1 Tax=Carboxylicivirga mesophila TaxID=1166478 RepID=A0ABS5K9L4_9BACT|nr:hypothetical protein [Carboxylicivirga mesophila]MBS2211639.1 hypothetical protein [Carboxylicivirga mesophila]
MAIMLLFFYSLSMSEMLILTSLPYDFKAIMSAEYEKIGVLSAGVSLSVFILDLAVGLILGINLVGLVGLKEKARHTFIILLPIYLLTHLFDSYKYLIRKQEQDFYFIYVAQITIVTALVIYTYTRPFMKRIFLGTKLKKTNTNINHEGPTMANKA